MQRICFVCLGNICRSPIAEGVFEHLAELAGCGAEFQVESAGVGGWHVGEAPDSRARKTAAAHGIRLDGAAQQLRARDLDRFDLLLALDTDVASDLRQMAAHGQRGKIRLLREFDPLARGDLDVPDPYYGSMQDFENVYQMIERACRGLLDSLSTGDTDGRG